MNPLTREWVEALNTYSVDVRYPGENADATLAHDAVSHCCTVREALRRSLGL